MAHIMKVGNSLFALVPAHAARQLLMSERTPIRVLVEVDCIKIIHANPPPAGLTPRIKATAADSIQEEEEPW